MDHYKAFSLIFKCKNLNLVPVTVTSLRASLNKLFRVIRNGHVSSFLCKQSSHIFLNGILFCTTLIFSLLKVNASFISLENPLPHEVKDKFQTLP